METSTSQEPLIESTTPLTPEIRNDQTGEIARTIPTKTDEKAEIQSLLAEARNTKAMIEGFIGAVRGGRFDGGAMMDLAKGMAFLQAIHKQNKAHIENLQERLK